MSNHYVSNGVNRRQVLVMMAAGSSLLVMPRWGIAQDKGFSSTESLSLAERAFLSLSQRLTERDDLDAVIAARTYEALVGQDAGAEQAIADLAALAGASTSDDSSAAALLAKARGAGLDDMLFRIQTAWYTGTVADDSLPIAEYERQVQVIAYQRALMYRPVSDGLPVPTYCKFGPLYWADGSVPATPMPASL